MQMIDVLKRLKELESQGSEVTEAIKSVENMSAKVNEGVNITMSGVMLFSVRFLNWQA